MLIFAHRGAARTRQHENTIDAFAEALDAGCQLESDARVSSDGAVVMIHDSFVRRWPFFHRAARRSGGQLARAGVPTIDDVYRKLGGEFELSIDIKVAAAGPLVIAAAERAGATSRLWLVSDRIDLLEQLRALNSTVKLVHESRAGRIGNRLAHSQQLAAARIDAQNTDVLGWQPESVEQSHACGVLAFGSLANDQRRFDRAAELGIDALYTDRLELARSALT